MLDNRVLLKGLPATNDELAMTDRWFVMTKVVYCLTLRLAVSSAFHSYTTSFPMATRLGD